jgi:hypothetical protein
MSDPAGNLVDKIDVLKEDRPVLFDAKDKPLVRVVGFRPKDKEAR